MSYVRVYDPDSWKELLTQDDTFTQTGGSNRGDPRKKAAKKTSPRKAAGSSQSLHGNSQTQSGSVRTRRRSSLAMAMESSAAEAAIPRNESAAQSRRRRHHNATMARQLKELQENVAEAKRRNAKAREERYQDLINRLETGKHEAEYIERKVDMHLEERSQRKAQMHQEWTKMVFEPIQKAVDDAVAQRSVKQSNRLRNREYQKYLDASNQRDLFTDVVDESYDPHVLHKLEPRPFIPRLQDPLKRTIHTQLEETAILATKQAELQNSLAASKAHGAPNGTMRRSVRSGGFGASRSRSTPSLRRPASTPGVKTLRNAGSQQLLQLSATIGSSLGHMTRSEMRNSSKKLGFTLAEPRFIPGRDPKSVLGRHGGKSTLPTTTWGAGQLEARSEVATVTRKDGITRGPLADVAGLQAKAARQQAQFDKGRDNVMGDWFTKHSPEQQAKWYNAAMPKPTKRTFAPMNNGAILASVA